MRRIKEEADKTRQTILDTALTVFSSKGYHPSRLQDIAEAAGVTRGAIYHHFGSKADLYICLVRESAEQLNSVITQAIEGGGTFQEVATRVLVSGWSLLEEDPQLAKVVELFNFKTGFTAELEEINIQRKEEAKTQVVFIAGFFQRAIDNGELNYDLDPELAARAFMAYQNGIMNLWLTNQTAFSLRKSAPVLAATFFKGIEAM
jgi:TetR/AcrR family transcriptional regulator, acrAB operon repressor